MESSTKATGKVRKTNLLHCLFDRENNIDRSKIPTHVSTPQSHMKHELQMFKCFPPNFTIQNVDRPLGYMRKFTPDGQMLLCISQDLESLEVYEFNSIGAMADLLMAQTGECITAADHSQQSLHIRQQAFRRLFVLRSAIDVKYGMAGGHLNREFSLFFEGSRFVVIASMGVAAHKPNIRDLYNYPDLYDDFEHFFYNFYLIDLACDGISDFITYKYDNIQLSHNHGVSCCRNKLAILSRYRQCIDLYQVSNGNLKKLHEIGRWNALIEEPRNEPETIGYFKPCYKRPLTHFKQRIITFLFRRINEEENLNTRRDKMHNFYKNFPKYEDMVITKMQMLTSNTILMRYEQHPQQQTRHFARDDQSLQLYVFYRIKSEQILNVFEGTSEKLLHALRDYCDCFRGVRSCITGRRPSSSSNNIVMLRTFNETVSVLNEPIGFLNRTLPISSQSYSASPYLDNSLFSYDESHISAVERPRLSLTETLVFRDRITDCCLFRLHLEPNVNDFNFNFSLPEHMFSARPIRELVAFIFHPYEPFIISVQKFSQRYVVNFHIYNKWTIVRQ